MEFSFEKMKLEDLEAVLEIAKRSMSNPWTREMFENEFLKNPFSDQLLAKVNGKIAGYLFWMTLFDECHVMDFAVHPDFRRKGIGEKIIFHLIEKMLVKNIRTIFLEVRISNQPALAIYRKAGFLQIAVRKNYYSNPKEDAMILQWKAPSDLI